MMMKIIGQQRLLGHEDMGPISNCNTRKGNQRIKNGIFFKREEYSLILEHVRHEDGYQQVWAQWEFPHPEGPLVLQRSGQFLPAWHGPNNLKITPMPPQIPSNIVWLISFVMLTFLRYMSTCVQGSPESTPFSSIPFRIELKKISPNLPKLSNSCVTS
ncbi:hypothetical protein O181_042269 [Austropuccinia psidii MF-1]|uniref:Uncharacterized protein n=1 Tax=Austropuccinia psidii MF-1 TaxID=1389203 RepID=A0A9Q3HHB2_9BASI|nr:hypothetical protein [Austropuccinia psidii MF-1]